MSDFKFIDGEIVKSYEDKIDALKEEMIECLGENIYHHEIEHKKRKPHEMGKDYSIKLDVDDFALYNSPESEIGKIKKCAIMFTYSEESKPMLYVKAAISIGKEIKIPVQNFSIDDVFKMVMAVLGRV